MTSPVSFRTQECSNQDCRFRFPVLETAPRLDTCPKCGARINEIGITYPRHRVEREALAPHAPEIHLLLDNIRSIYNVGSIFRTAAATGITKIHLCGMTATPDNPRLAKTAIGAEKMVVWEYHLNGLLAAKTLAKAGISLWAIEGGEKATSLFDAKIPKDNRKIALIIGNELAGIDPEIMELTERILYIPMQGEKESLNLTVAFGIAAYYLRYF